MTGLKLEGSSNDPTMNASSMINVFFDRGGRAVSVLLLLFWGAFFVEHLAEWFLRADGRLPPPFVWAAQFLHLGMLLALGWSAFRPLSGSFAILLTTAAFFGCIRAFPSIALINVLPVAMAWSNWRLTTRDPRTAD